MEGSILELLSRHGSLAYEQIASILERRPDDVRTKLADMRGRGLVDAVSFGKLEGNVATAASYWRLTEKGRNEATRRRGS